MPEGKYPFRGSNRGGLCCSYEDAIQPVLFYFFFFVSEGKNVKKEFVVLINMEMRKVCMHGDCK